jgi:ABC-type polysaccharide/polyol phosphate transport system ATPase subunit
MNPIVVVEDLYKKYSRNSTSHIDYGLKDFFLEMIGKSQSVMLREDEFYAVKDISFYIEKGQSIALIGRNGCGKTTLLKMIAGIIKPTNGKIIINGRVQALIALGAGFDSKLSGRENIYNSASIMGLNKRETEEIISEIIEFAELEEFIDSPVGTYSSGMYARLGFSVAINLKPDILLVDEILSVGDYVFQNKCFVKMHELKKQGVSIILVSHSHTHVTQLCDTAIWLERGCIQQYGEAKKVVGSYLDHMDTLQAEKIKELNSLKKENASISVNLGSRQLYGAIYDEEHKIYNLKLNILDKDMLPIESFATLSNIYIEYSFDIIDKVQDLNVSVNIFRADGLLITTISTLNGDLLSHKHGGSIHARIKISDIPLNPGEYVIVLPVHEGHSYLYRNVVKKFLVTKQQQNMHWGLNTWKYDYEVI